MIKKTIAVIFTLMFTIPAYTQSEDHTLPNLDLISITQLDNVHVVITGDKASVASFQQLAVTNLYTNHRECIQANADGSFEVNIFGHEKIPFAIANINTCTLVDYFEEQVIFYHDYETETPISFGIGGWISWGYIPWIADSTINSINFNSNDILSITMNIKWALAQVYNNSPQYPLSEASDKIIGKLSLRKLNIENPFLNDEENWSHQMTSSGIELTSHEPDIIMATVQAETIEYNREQSIITFTLEYNVQLNDLPDGIYIPVFSGELSVDNEDFVPWYFHRDFASDGIDGVTIDLTSKPHPIVFPFTIRISGGGK